MPGQNSAQAIEYGIFDTLRRLCESHQLDFFVVLQTASPAQQGYWTSSKDLRNLCGDLITKFATFVDADDDGATTTVEDVAVVDSSTSDVAAVGTMEGDELKMEVEEDIVDNNSTPQMESIATEEATTEITAESDPSRMAAATAEAMAEDAKAAALASLSQSPDSSALSKISVDDGTESARNKVFGVYKRVGLGVVDTVADDECILLPAEELEEDEVLDENEAGEVEDDAQCGEEEEGEDDPKEVMDQDLRENSQSSASCNADPVVTIRVDGNGYSLQGSPETIREGTLTLVSGRVGTSTVTKIVKVSKPISKYSIIVGSEFDKARHEHLSKIWPLQREDDPSVHYLDDDLNQETVETAFIPQPHIWKRHEYDRPFRPSTIKRLFEDKIVFSRFLCRYHVFDYDYVGLLSSLIKQSNPHCILHPKSLCRYMKGQDIFFAEFYCRYDSCSYQCHVKISCGTNKVTVDHIKSKPKKVASGNPVLKEIECPFITFSSHDGDDIPDKPPINVDKKQLLKGAINADSLDKFFVSQLSYDEEDKRSFVSSNDYMSVLEPIIASVNPYCRFGKVLTPCFHLKNKQKENLKVCALATRLGCQVRGCRTNVHVHVGNPSGDVTLSFQKPPIGAKHEQPANDNDDSPLDDGGGKSEDVITLNHTGSLIDIKDVDWMKKQKKQTINKFISSIGRLSRDEADSLHASSNSADDISSSPSVHFLKLPATIVCDEKLSKEFLQEHFISKFDAIPIGKGERPRSLPDSGYLMFIRRIVDKYNPNCALFGAGARILRRSLSVRVSLMCKKKDCDFGVVCNIDCATGVVRLDFKNYNHVYHRIRKGSPPAFCFIRHDKGTVVRHVRLPERVWYYERIGDMSAREIADKYGLSVRTAMKLRSEAKEWRKSKRKHGPSLQQLSAPSVDANGGTDSLQP